MILYKSFQLPVLRLLYHIKKKVYLFYTCVLSRCVGVGGHDFNLSPNNGRNGAARATRATSHQRPETLCLVSVSVWLQAVCWNPFIISFVIKESSLFNLRYCSLSPSLSLCRRCRRFVHTSGETVPDTNASEAVVAGRVGDFARVTQPGETTGTGTVWRSLDGSVITIQNN